jgi:hypothetical protein
MVSSISVYSEPSDDSPILYQRYRDEVVNLYCQVVSEHGPDYNPIWYRVWGGYVHSACLQIVKQQLNPVVSSIRVGGTLVKFLCVLPRKPAGNGSMPVNRNYACSCYTCPFTTHCSLSHRSLSQCSLRSKTPNTWNHSG